MRTIEVQGSEIRCYESEATGFRATLVQTGEPICRLYVALATEADTCDWAHKVRSAAAVETPAAGPDAANARTIAQVSP